MSESGLVVPALRRPLHCRLYCCAAFVTDALGRLIVYRSFGTADTDRLNLIVWKAALRLDVIMPVQHAKGSQYQKKRGGLGHDLRLFTIHQSMRDVSPLN